MKNDMTVYDHEKGRVVKTNPDRVAMAKHLNGVVRGASMAMAIGIAEIFDGKYYRELGCATQEEYCQLHLDFGWRTAKKYATVGRAIMPMIGEIKPGESIAMIQEKGKSTSLSENQSGENQETDIEEDSLQSFGDLGIEKMYSLIRAESVDVADVIQRGKVIFEDGREIDLIDFEAMSVRESQAILNAKSRAQDARVAEVEEKLKLMRSEHAAEKSELVTLRKQSENAAAIEAQYGVEVFNTSELAKQLNRADALLNELESVMMNCGIEDKTDHAQKARFYNLYRYVGHVQERIKRKHDLYLMDIGDEMLPVIQPYSSVQADQPAQEATLKVSHQDNSVVVDAFESMGDGAKIHNLPSLSPNSQSFDTDQFDSEVFDA